MTIPEEDVFFPIHPLCADIWKFAFIHGFKKVVQYSLKVSIHIEFIPIKHIQEISLASVEQN